MRSMALAILSLGAAYSIAPAQAQTYNPDYPVCLHVMGPLNYNECDFSSLQQCKPSASGRAAECIVNPFYAQAYQAPPVRHVRQHRRALQPQ